MVIHTKEKAKIHVHSPVQKTDMNKVNAKSNNQSKSRFAKAKELAKNSNQSIKVKNRSLKVAGAAGAKTATDKLEGGRELQESTAIAYTLTSPAIKASRMTSSAIGNKAKEMAKKKFKKVEAGKKIAKKTTKKLAKDTVKTATKETTKKVAKETAKTTAKVVAKTASSTAGSCAGPYGLLIGTAVGEVVSKKMDVADMKASNRSRKIKFFLDKTNSQEKQKDSFGKMIKDVLFKKIATVISMVAPLVGMALLPIILIIGAIAAIIMAVVGFIYNSPLALFLPPLEDGDTVTTVASAYYAEFNRDVNTEANDYGTCDMGMVVYTGAIDNYNDILAIYMVEYGNGDTATIMTDSAKDNLQKVVDDMCSYTITYGYEDVADPGGTITSKYVKRVEVTLKTYQDMITEYGFDEKEVEWIEKMMSPEYMGSY